MPGPSRRCPRRVTFTFGLFGKDRVEMRGNDEARTRRVARTIAEHVAGAIDANVLKPELRELALAAPRRAPSP